MDQQRDVIVVGGGPAGLSCAIDLRLRGRHVLLIERHEGPQDKACGEGLMPDGVALLARLGVDVRQLGPQVLRGVSYTDGDLRLEIPWRGAPAYGVRRLKLSEALRMRAREVGVEFLTAQVTRVVDGCAQAAVETVNRRFAASLVVGADGLHSRVRRALVTPDPRPPSQHRRLGVRQHFAVTPWSDLVEVYLAAGREAYVTPVGTQEVGVAVLGSHVGGASELPLDAFPALAQRLSHAKATSRVRGAGPMAQPVKQVGGHRVALVGDASGYLDAITGEGITLALAESAALAAAFDGPDSARIYEQHHRRLRRRYMLSVTAMLWVGRVPRFRRLLLRLGRWLPSLSRWLAHYATSLPSPPPPPIHERLTPS